MTIKETNTEIVWTPQMPDRRKGDRRSASRTVHPNGQQMSIQAAKVSERRAGPDRRKQVTVTITGRAMDVNQH